MKNILIAVVLAGMSSGVCAADFSSLQTIKPLDFKEATVVPASAPREVAPKVYHLDVTRRSHKTTWTTLTALSFIPKVSFRDAGSLIVDDGQSVGAAHIRAAEAIDYVFVEWRGAKRIKDMDQVLLIAQALVKKNINVRNFADRMESLYVFRED